MVNIPRWQSISILLAVLFGIAYALPNLFSQETLEELPDWLPNKQINLGLDLRGGSYLLYQVEMEQVFRQELDNLVGEVRSSLRQEQIGYTGLGIEENAVVLTLRDPADAEAVREALELLRQNRLFSIDDEGNMRLELTDQELRERRSTIMAQSIEVVRRRIDELGTREPSIQRQGDDRIIIQVPGLEDPDRVGDILGKTAKLTFHLVNEEVTLGSGIVPATTMILPLDDGGSEGTEQIAVFKRVEVSGGNLVSASLGYDGVEPLVNFRFDAEGAKRFGEATRKNVNRRLAIVLDEAVISAPVIRSPILGGSGQISGAFSVTEAQDLALLLRAGALPADLTNLEKRSIGPGLGADSIAAGEIAAVLGLVFVVIFMAVIYGVFGAIAAFGLLINLVLIAAALSGLQATLTLPGIAGIVLTIGMAVDANVLIFERVREEVAGGRGVIQAVDSGYRRAMTTIIDANLTTLIAAMLLFAFGTGPVKGFAVTLAIGIITSMFSAIMVTRAMIVLWLRQKQPKALGI